MWVITNIADLQPNVHRLVTFCCHYILVSESQISYCLQGNMLDVEMEIGEGLEHMVYKEHISEAKAQGAYDSVGT